jgi:hypothetical protein
MLASLFRYLRFEVDIPHLNLIPLPMKRFHFFNMRYYYPMRLNDCRAMGGAA